MFHRMVRFAAAAGLLLAGIAAGQAPGSKFETFRSTKGRFSVLFPGKPKEKTSGTPGKTQEVSFRAGVLPAYQVSYLDFPENVIKGRDPQELLKLFRSGYRKDRKFEGDKEITLGKKKIPGREYVVVADKNAIVRERLFLAGNRLYVQYVVTLGTRNALTSKEANDFFDSFEITD